MSTTPYKNYSQAHEAFLAAWEAMQCLPDAPNEDAIALDGLRAVLPLTTKRKLIHNYRYREVAAVVEATFPKLTGKVENNYVGTTIGSHTGPGTVALFFWGGKRE